METIHNDPEGNPQFRSVHDDSGKFVHAEMLDDGGKVKYMVRVSKSGSVLYCTCLGYRYHRQCKHLLRVRTQIGSLPGPQSSRNTRNRIDAPNVLLLQRWNPETDPVGMMASEKMEGVFVRYNGTVGVTRSGSIIPSWLTSNLPKGIEMDMELWAGRGAFGTCTEALDAPTPNGARLVAFDLVSDDNFDVRYRRLERLSKRHGFECVEQHVVPSPKWARVYLTSIIRDGGEGVVIRDMYDGGYRKGRNSRAYKMKPKLHEEAIAVRSLGGRKWLFKLDRVGGDDETTLFAMTCPKGSIMRAGKRVYFTYQPGSGAGGAPFRARLMEE